MNLLFSSNKLIDRLNFAQLPEIQQAQFLVAGKNAWGQEVSLIEIFENSEGEQMHWEYFQVMDVNTSEWIFDAWILGDDSGTVFYANSIKSTEIEMCQSYFDAVVSDEKVKQLEEPISNAYKQAKKVFDDENGFNGELFDKYWNGFYGKADDIQNETTHWEEIQTALAQKYFA